MFVPYEDAVRDPSYIAMISPKPYSKGAKIDTMKPSATERRIMARGVFCEIACIRCAKYAREHPAYVSCMKMPDGTGRCSRCSRWNVRKYCLMVGIILYQNSLYLANLLQ